MSDPGNSNDDDGAVEIHSDDEDANDLEPEMEEIETRWHHGDEQQAQAIEVAVDQALEEAQNIPQAEIVLAQMPPDGAAVQNAVVEPPGADQQGREQAADLQQADRDLRQQVEAVEPENQNSASVKYLLVTCTVVGGIAGLMAIIAQLKNWISPPSNNAARALVRNVGDADSGGIAVIGQAWLNSSDQAFWNRLADFVAEQKPRGFQEQLIFLQMTVHLANGLMNHPWKWASAGDKLNLIEDLMNTIRDSGLSGAYRKISTMTYGSAALPRAVAADLLSLGLTKWFVNYG